MSRRMSVRVGTLPGPAACVTSHELKITAARMRLLMPCPGRADDVWKFGSTRGETEPLLGVRRIGNQNGWIAGPSLAHRHGNALASFGLDGFQNLPYRIADACSQIEDATAIAVQKQCERRDMGSCEVIDMDIVPDRRSIRSIVVIAKNSEA